MPSEHRIHEKYHILDNPLPGAWAEKLLGRIVFDKANPTASTAPPNDGENGSSIPQNIVPSIAEDRLAYTNLNYVLNDFKDIGQHAKLTRFFEERATREAGTDHAITAINAERIDMSNIPDKLKTLWANEAYREAAKEMLWQKGHTVKLGMVTGIWVSKSLTVRVGNDKQVSVSGKVDVPVSEATGDPTGTADVSMGAEYASGKTKMESFEIAVPTVFAVAYTEVGLRPIQRKSDKNKKPSLFRRLRNGQKNIDDVELEIYVDTSPGAKLFAGSSSSSSDSDSEGSEAGSETSTRIDVPPSNANPEIDVDEGSEIRSTASTRVEEEPHLVENAPYIFTSPESVFGKV